MSFNVAYRHLCDQNIKHIFTTRDQPIKRSPVKKLYNPEFLKLEIQARKRRHRKFDSATFEYYPQFDIQLPRAPAFRAANSDYVDHMVSRLTQPQAVKTNPRGCVKYNRGYARYMWEEEEEEEKKRSKKEMAEIIERLSRPTESFKARTGASQSESTVTTVNDWVF